MIKKLGGKDFTLEDDVGWNRQSYHYKILYEMVERNTNIKEVERTKE